MRGVVLPWFLLLINTAGGFHSRKEKSKCGLHDLQLSEEFYAFSVIRTSKLNLLQILIRILNFLTKIFT